MKDVPAMQIQDYTSSIENYISKLEFQLSEYRFPDRPVEKKMKIYGELITRTERSDDRKVILSGLANVHEVAALKLVEPLLNDSQVQAEAEVALLNIVDGIKGSAPAEALAAATKLQTESKTRRHVLAPPRFSARWQRVAEGIFNGMNLLESRTGTSWIC